GEPGALKLLAKIEPRADDGCTDRVFPFQAISPDGKKLVYCAASYLKEDEGRPRCDLVLFDLITSRELGRRQADYVNAGVFSSDGKHLAVGCTTYVSGLDA